MLTVDQIKQICTGTKNPIDLTNTLNQVLPTYKIDTKLRVAAFLAQCGHESCQFNVLKENLNYSSTALRTVWPSRFTSDEMAAPYHRKPEMIANKVYCDRMGNGSEASGEGYKFRGRGAIQLTGKQNYTKFAESINKTLDETVAYCETFEGAIASACYYWTVNNLNTYADSGDFVTLTKKINGGTNGLQDRQKHYDHALELIDETIFTESVPNIPVDATVAVAVIVPLIVEDIEIPDEEAVEKDEHWFGSMFGFFDD
tara:strand:+ start:763 stop:1533 length:771 start_codon:yes stop_codon:yes gene_type:complete